MPPVDEAGRIHCRLDELLEGRGMTLTRSLNSSVSAW